MTDEVTGDESRPQTSQKAVKTAALNRNNQGTLFLAPSFTMRSYACWSEFPKDGRQEITADTFL